MSRSGYTEDLDVLQLGRWRAIIRSASKGKRGQAFFRSLVEALDSMPVKSLIADDMEDDGGCVCALGALDRHRGGSPGNLDPYDYQSLGDEFNIAHQLAQEVMFMNDQGTWKRNESPEDRWLRMRNWAAAQAGIAVIAEAVK